MSTDHIDPEKLRSQFEAVSHWEKQYAGTPKDLERRPDGHYKSPFTSREFHYFRLGACAAQAELQAAAPTTEAPAARLTKPARVGGGSFGVGVPERNVIEAAQRHYEQEGTRKAMTAEEFADEERKRRTLWELIHGPLTAAHQAPAPTAVDVLADARRAVSAIATVGQYNDQDVILRKSVLDMLNHSIAAPALVAPVKILSQAARDVLAERRRQVEAEGRTAEHDDGYQGSELALAAAWYAIPPFTRNGLDANDMSLWPIDWPSATFKPGDRRRELVKSGALAIAELERLDRAAAQAKEGGAR